MGNELKWLIQDGGGGGGIFNSYDIFLKHSPIQHTISLDVVKQSFLQGLYKVPDESRIHHPKSSFNFACAMPTLSILRRFVN